MSGRLIVISGPSGSGKSTIIKAIRDRMEDLSYSISHTTRNPREGETDGVHYHFVTRETFEAMVSRDEFVEWARVYDDLYGTSFAGLDRQLASGVDTLLDIDVQGARNIGEHYEDSILIFILPPSLEVLEQRLKDRGTDGEDTIRKRMAKARDEIGNCARYDYIIINEDLDTAINEAHAVMLSDRCRVSRRKDAVGRRFPDVFQ